VDIELPNTQACIDLVEVKNESIKKLRSAPAQSIYALYYNYFMGTDYNGYKNLFLTKDWFQLSESEFTEWRNFIENTDLTVLGFASIKSNGAELGIIKYTYVLDDQIIYETFLAKKAGNQWRPSSAQEEQDHMALTNLVRFSKPQYLATLISSVKQRSTSHADVIRNGTILPAKMMEVKDSLRMTQPVVYKERYNDEFEYRTNQKFKEDRIHDADFMSFLDEMKVTGLQKEKVMKLIYEQDYLMAASLADQYSDETYTYSPFVDKIREIYGRDRIKKWDSTTNKWN
jgi:hypothetical protein